MELLVLAILSFEKGFSLEPLSKTLENPPYFYITLV